MLVIIGEGKVWKADNTNLDEFAEGWDEMCKAKKDKQEVIERVWNRLYKGKTHIV